MTPTGMERRSAQQLERDSLRQRSFEARRAASQPQLLACDEEGNMETIGNKAQSQMPTPIRRGSYGNIMEAAGGHDIEKDSDDGGFLKRIGSSERRLETSTPQRDNNQTSGVAGNAEGSSQSNDLKTEVLQGMPRKKLEGEIGTV